MNQVDGAERRAVAAQAPLGGAEEQFRWLVEHSPVAMCVHVDGRYVYVNQTLLRKMAARSADQLLGRKISDFIHPDSLVAVRAQIASRQHDGDMSPPLEMAIVTLAGATRHVEAMAIRTLWEGRPAHKVVFRDVSEQKATEAALRFQAALVDHVSDAIISTTTTGFVTSWNPAAAAIYRRSAVDALGMPISEVVATDIDLAAIVAGGGVVNTTHRAGDGSELAVRVSVSRMNDGFVVSCADHTALRRAEQLCQVVVASLQEGVVVITADGTVESVNPATLRIFGADHVGKRCRRVRKSRRGAGLRRERPAAHLGAAPGHGDPQTQPAPMPASTVSTDSATASGYGCRSPGRCSTPAIRTGRQC